MMRYISANDAEIISDDKGQYYAVSQRQNEIVMETIKDVDGRYVSYTLNFPKEFYKDIYQGIDYKDIVNNIDFIE